MKLTCALEGFRRAGAGCLRSTAMAWRGDSPHRRSHYHRPVFRCAVRRIRFPGGFRPEPTTEAAAITAITGREAGGGLCVRLCGLRAVPAPAQEAEGAGGEE